MITEKIYNCIYRDIINFPYSYTDPLNNSRQI